MACFYFVLSQNGYAQRQLPNFNGVKIEESVLFDKEDGIPHLTIRGMAETDDGFIWFATGDGLCRFDGSTFKCFGEDETDPTAIYDNRISALLADDSTLYIGTHLGFSIMDLQTESFRNYQFEHYQRRDTLSKQVPTRVSEIVKGTDGDIWFSTYSDGVFRYQPARDTFINYHFPQAEVAKYSLSKTRIDRVIDLRADRFNDNVFWAGTRMGLLRIDGQTHKIDWYLYPATGEQQFNAQNSIIGLYQHDDGLLYLSSWHAQVNIFDPQRDSFYLLPIHNENALERAEAYKLLESPTRPIKRKNAEEIWIQSLDGLMTYNTVKKTASRVQWNKLQYNLVYGVELVDSKQRAWLSAPNGIMLFDPVQQQFVPYDYQEYNIGNRGFTYYFIAPFGKKELAVLPKAADGIYLLDSHANTWEKIKVDPRYCLIDDEFGPRGWSQAPDGTYTVISLSGIYTLDAQKQSLRPFPLPKRYQSLELRSIHWDTQGNLWLGTANSGLLRWQKATNHWELIKEVLEPGLPRQRAETIREFKEDRRQNIWFARKNGYSVYWAEQDTFLNFLNTKVQQKAINFVHDFAEDHQGRMWISSPAGGLSYASVANPRLGIQQHYDLMQLHDINYISFLRTDAAGQLWGLHEDKLCKIDPDSVTITYHDIRYGVQEDEIYNFQILPDGRFILGGRNKIWLADPKEFTRNYELPKPYITNIAVLQEPFQTSTPYHLVQSLDLGSAQNFFSFNFSAIAFTRGEDTQFRYRLRNFENFWTATEGRRFANFTNVPPGEYVFELQAANNEGLWNNDILELVINVATPWWQTAWFWLLFSILLISIGYSLYRWRITQVRREVRMRSEYEGKLAEMEMSALRAQMNPHFIFNSLNSIEYFIIKNEQEKASDYLNRFSRLIRLILQNSKSTIVPLADDLEAHPFDLDI
ncbi:MAG: histidine kinase [Bacteroidota bacterium]